MLKRIVLFLLTNLAIVFVLNIVLRVLGVDRIIARSGGNLMSWLVFAAIVGFAGSLISLAVSKWLAKKMTGAQVIQQPRNSTERWLLDTVEGHSRRAGIGMPDVAIYDAPEINAFATGWNRNAALVAVSSGLLHSMTQDEADAVLSHELSHVANGDMVTLALIQGVVNTFVIFLSRIIGQIVDRAIFKTERGNGAAFFITSIVAQLVLGVLASMIVMWFSRWREFHADAGGAKLAGRHKMIAALERLKALHEPSRLPTQMQAFGISGDAGGGLRALLRSHPPLEERIAALKAAV